MDPRIVLAGDLVGHWVAENLSDLVDHGANVAAWLNSVDGTQAAVHGNPTFAQHDLGGRAIVRFDSSDGVDWFEIARVANPLAGGDDFSVAVYFRTDTNELLGGNDEWFQNTGLVDSNQLGFTADWGVSINSAGQIAAGLGGGFVAPSTTIYSSVAGLHDGAAHLAVVTRSGSSLSIYVDGQLTANTDTANSGLRSSDSLAIGALLGGKNGFSGDIGEVRLYDGELSASEITSLHTEVTAFYDNRAPEANDDQYDLTEDDLLFFARGNDGVLQNDVDAEGEPLTAELVEATKHGSLTLNPDGSFVYVPERDFFGTDTFTYQAIDFRPGRIATVSLHVAPAYDAPDAVPDSYLLRPGEVATKNAAEGVLANDGNPDQVTFTAALVDDVTQGSLNFRPDGSFDYDPQGFTGRATFTYRIDDGTQQTDPIGVTLAVSTPPRAVDDQYEVDEDSQLLVLQAADNPLANDIDAENDPLVISLVDDVSHGQLTLRDNGTFIYVPNPDYHGPDEFTYRANDGFDDSPVATVHIDVRSVNDLPIAEGEGYYVLPGRTLQIGPEKGLLINDSDLEQTDLQAVVGQLPANGTLTLNADGSFTYVPNEGFEGTDTFTYRADDGIDQTAETTVNLGVLAQPFVINEFMASNIDTITTRLRVEPEDRFRGIRETFDWIEIHNLLPNEIDLGGLHLTDDEEEPMKFRIPEGTIIEADGYLLVFASGLDIVDHRLDENNALHTNFKISSEGEYLALTAADGTVLHEFDPEYPAQLGDISYGLTSAGFRYLLTPTPGEANADDGRMGLVDGPTIDTDHGFFTESFSVTITNGDPASTVRYTTDGSEPTEDSGSVYDGTPIEIHGTSVLRARSFLDGHLPSRTDTRTYIFLTDVVTQSNDGQPPAGWPQRWGSNRTDYGMDPDIVNDEVWGPQMEAALTQIPSMSIVTDLDNLFDTRNGIYSRASNDGQAWERPASLELINPDGSEGFQHNIGLRIRGGFSRSSNNPKHAFRIFFDSVYGDGWLNFPLFEDEGANTFAKVDLRTTQNYSWAFQNDGRNTFLRDIFSRDLQGAMGHQYTRGRFYHLYINGQYFGLFQTDERPEARFGATYYGGDPEDYDVVHNDPRDNGATDGNLDAYRRLWEEFTKEGGLGDVNSQDYYRVQGLNTDGTRNPDYERMLDVDNVIDYMIITYYTSDADGPGSKFTRPGLNNYFAVYNREDPDGWKFFEHDSEHSLDTGNAAGANYNMVSPLVRNGRTFNRFNPHWMHEELANSNSDYLVRFRDRVAELFDDDGLLGDENVIRMLRERASQFDMAIIAESARWGDAGRPRPFTKRDWERAVDNTVRWVTSRQRGEGRRAEVLTQLEREGWWLFDVNRPTFSQDGGRVDAGFSLAVTREGEGSIYVTTDGSDPRMPGGAINPEAIMVQPGASVSIDTGGLVKARVRLGNDWSPLQAARFFVEPLADASSLRVSEVHFNPADASDPEAEAGFDNNDDFEFIELVNVGNQTIDLTGTKLNRINIDDGQEGVEFDFTSDLTRKLAPGERLLVVEDLAAFQLRYGDQLPVAGQWAGGLSNAGETITLQFADGTLHQFSYDDQWHAAADGGGASLEAVSESAADLQLWNAREGWRPSAIHGGSPGRPSQVPGDANGDGLFNSSDLVLVFQAGEYEDAIDGNSTFADGDWNGDGDFTSGDLVFAFIHGRFVDTEPPAAISALFRHDRFDETRSAQDGSRELDPLNEPVDPFHRDRFFEKLAQLSSDL